MVDIIELIKQDISIAESYLITKKFEDINIVGNRILQNLFVINNKELMISGLIIKEISLDLLQIKTKKWVKPQDLEQCVVRAKECLEGIRSGISNKEAYEKIWNAYYDFEDKTRKYALNPEEREMFKDDFEFATEATINYLNILISNKDYLLKRNINPLEITRAEIAGLVNSHGGKNALFGYLIIKAFEHVYRFILFGKVSDEELESLVNMNVTKLNEVVRLIQEMNEYDLIQHTSLMIGDLMYYYRKYFMLYGELKDEFVQEIPLPYNASQKIQKIIDRHKGK